MWQQFTERAWNVVLHAQEIAADSGCAFVGTGHVLMAICSDEEATALGTLYRLGADSEWVIAELEDRIVRDTSESGADLQMSDCARRAIELARLEARSRFWPVIGTQQLLLGLSAEGSGLAYRTLRIIGIDLERARTAVREIQIATLQRKLADANQAAKRQSGERLASAQGAAEGMQGAMWQRFTVRAKRAVSYSQQEAGHLAANLVGTQHLLLALMRDRDSVACTVLARVEHSADELSEGIKAAIEQGPSDALPPMELSRQAKRAIDLAYDEARLLGSRYIGTEHLLLGLIREEDGLAGRVLAQLGVELDTIRAGVRQLQDGYGPRPPEAPPA